LPGDILLFHYLSSSRLVLFTLPCIYYASSIQGKSFKSLPSLIFFFVVVVHGFELGAYTLNYSTSFFFLIVVLVGWGYIVAFTKVFTMCQP
jgi:hypothetical protein